MTFHIDLDGIITAVNDASLYFFNLEKDKMLQRHFSEFFQIQKSKFDQKNNIFVAKNAAGDDIFFHADIIPLTNNKQEVIQNIIIAQDITHLKRIKKELEYAQEHDTLTGLPNRHAFLKAIDKEIAKGQTFSVLFLNIDDFSHINEDYGAHAGDMLLKHLAELLGAFIEEGDMLMRIQADNFAIIFEQEKSQDYIALLLKKLHLLAQENPLLYSSDDTITYSYSLVLLHYPQSAKSAKEFLSNAQKEMQRKKVSNRR
jgi:diguanylate cyclase (GGDEF)-like protein